LAHAMGWPTWIATAVPTRRIPTKRGYFSHAFGRADRASEVLLQEKRTRALPCSRWRRRIRAQGQGTAGRHFFFCEKRCVRIFPFRSLWGGCRIADAGAVGPPSMATSADIVGGLSSQRPIATIVPRYRGSRKVRPAGTPKRRQRINARIRPGHGRRLMHEMIIAIESQFYNPGNPAFTASRQERGRFISSRRRGVWTKSWSFP